MIGLCFEYLSIWCIWLYVLVMSHMRFRVNSHSSCLNVKKLLAQSRHEIWSLSDCNWTRTQNHLVYKRTLNHSTKLAKWLSCALITCLYGTFDCMWLSCQYGVWIHCETYVTWQEHTVRCTVQINNRNTAQSFGQFG